MEVSGKKFGHCARGHFWGDRVLTSLLPANSVVNAVVDGFEQIDFWVAMFFDSMSLTFTLICLGECTQTVYS